jgi:hypothetical protein
LNKTLSRALKALVCFGVAYNVSASGQTRSPLTCSSIAEGYVTNAPVTGVLVPQASQVWLSVDVPENGTPISLEMFARLQPDYYHKDISPWIKCEAAKQCGGVQFADGTSLQTKGRDWADGSIHYSSMVSLRPTHSFTDVVPYPTWARLVVNYTVANGDSCISQLSYQVSANQSSPMTLLVPAGKKIEGYETFATVITPEISSSSPKWMPCDVSDGNKFSKHNQCAPGNPGVIGFEDALFVDEFDKSPGYYNICHNSHGRNPRACRIRIRYKD